MISRSSLQEIISSLARGEITEVTDENSDLQGGMQALEVVNVGTYNTLLKKKKKPLFKIKQNLYNILWGL